MSIPSISRAWGSVCRQSPITSLSRPSINRAANPRPRSVRRRTMDQSRRTACGSACGCAAAASAPRSSKRTAFIALGSNLGDRVGEIEKACREMNSRGIMVKKTSNLWETEPMYVLDQDRFVNGACEVRKCRPSCYPGVVWPTKRMSGRDGA